METTDGPNARVEKPLVVFDGDCHFCRRWITRWNKLTTDRVDYQPSQVAAKDFPSISREEFDREVKLILPGGQVYGGAAAVFRVLAVGNGATFYCLLLWIYEHVALFRLITDYGYRVVARHRAFFSVMLRWL